MRSVTSCFNGTLYRKTMARFWPMWVLYGAIWMFLIPLNLLDLYLDELRFDMHPLAAQEVLAGELKCLPSMLEGGVWVACIAGVLVAMAAFGYLYNNRAASMMHTLPMRRETLFATQYLSGLSFLLLPHLVVGMATAAITVCLLPSAQWGEGLGYLATWLLGQSGNSLFFYSFAVFCAMFTGNILALPAFYAILNALVVGGYALLSALMEEFFYGFPGLTGNNRFVMACTPVWALIEAGDWVRERNGVYYNSVYWRVESPETFAAYAVAGVVFALLALLVYRRRHVETAGDVVSVPVVRPIFRFGVAFCSGLAFGLFVAAFFGWNDLLEIGVCVVLSSVVGWFAAEMLLKKSFRVFRAWRGAIVTAVLMAVLCVACELDWFGMENRIPRAEDVASINISADIGVPYDSGTMHLADLTDPKAVAQIITLHQAVVNQRNRQGQSGDEYIYLDLIYMMKDGSTLERRYYSVPIWKEELNQEGAVTWAAAQLINNRDLVARCYGFAEYEDWHVAMAYLSDVYRPDGEVESLTLSGSKAELQQLWQAVQQDFAEGNIGVRYLFEDEQRYANTYITDLCFDFVMPEEYLQQMEKDSSAMKEMYFSITMTPHAKHTLDWLEKYTRYEGEGSEFFLPHPFEGQQQGRMIYPKAAENADLY